MAQNPMGGPRSVGPRIRWVLSSCVLKLNVNSHDVFEVWLVFAQEFKVLRVLGICLEIASVVELRVENMSEALGSLVSKGGAEKK